MLHEEGHALVGQLLPYGGHFLEVSLKLRSGSFGRNNPALACAPAKLSNLFHRGFLWLELAPYLARTSPFETGCCDKERAGSGIPAPPRSPLYGTGRTARRSLVSWHAPSSSAKEARRRRESRPWSLSGGFLLSGHPQSTLVRRYALWRLPGCSGTIAALAQGRFQCA